MTHKTNYAIKAYWILTQEFDTHTTFRNKDYKRIKSWIVMHIRLLLYMQHQVRQKLMKQKLFIQSENKYRFTLHICSASFGVTSGAEGNSLFV